MFRMYGRIIQLYRYKAAYTEKRPVTSEGENGEPVFSEEEIPVTGYFVTREEAEKTGGTVTELDTSGYDWLDGLEVPDVPDTFAAAQEIADMGQAAYNAKLAREAAQSSEQLRADVDYVMLMEGL